MTLNYTQKKILLDLERQLHQSCSKAVVHFLDMAIAAEIPEEPCAIAVIRAMLRSATCPAIASSFMTQEVFAQSAYNCYGEMVCAHRNEETEAQAKPT